MTTLGASGLSAVVTSSDGTVTTLVWVARLFLLVVGLGVLALLALAVRIFVWNPVREAWRARSAGNWWLPFEARPDGSYGPLCDLRRRGTFRAPPPDRRTASGLGLRWGLWTLLAGGTTAAVVDIVVRALAGVPDLWV